MVVDGCTTAEGGRGGEEGGLKERQGEMGREGWGKSTCSSIFCCQCGKGELIYWLGSR